MLGIDSVFLSSIAVKSLASIISILLLFALGYNEEKMNGSEIPVIFRLLMQIFPVLTEIFVCRLLCGGNGLNMLSELLIANNDPFNNQL